MMDSKASVFEDDYYFQKIIATSDPRQHESLGLAVRSFNQSVWDSTCEKYLSAGSYTIFFQNENWKRQLSISSAAFSRRRTRTT